LTLYTDGLPEAHAPTRVITPQNMIEQLETTAPTSAEAAIDALLALIGPGDSLRDDIAIVSAQVSGVSLQRPKPKSV
jgi:serine phosphatase RsbU (regulator of sigma subunit)